jgi:photosystem II stability/assembly factor-like uncharacterized protein
MYRSINDGASWTAIQLQPGSNSCGVTYHDTIPGLLWAAVGSGYYSEDDGGSWAALGTGLDQVQDVAAAPGSASRQTTTVFAAIRGGLYKSTDGGDTWQEADAGLGAVMTRTIAVSPLNADEAYAATQVKGILRTPDGGRSWQSVPVPLGNYGAAIAPDPFTDGQVFFGYGKTESAPIVRISTDRGATYTEHALPLPPEYADKWAYVSAIAPDPAVQDRWLAGVCVEGNWPEVGPGLIYASVDGGSTWGQQSTPTGIRCVLRLAHDPQDARLVYAATNGDGLLRSDDGGETWALLPSQPAGTQLGAVQIDPRDTDAIYVCSAGNVDQMGVFATQDGGDSWVKMEGLTEYPIWELALVQIGTGYRLYAATMNGLRHLDVPAGPSTPWEWGSGFSATATIDGFNAGTEEGRVVLYIGTSGGTLQSGLASLGGPASATTSQPVAGGVYRSMIRIYLAYLPLVTR